MIDLEPAARRIAELVRDVPDDALGAPTPCSDYTLGDLLDHVGGLALAFAAAARKEPLEGGPSGDASRLGDDWRERIPRDLLTLAETWRDEGAWTGMTRAGGVDLPGEVAGKIALDELVIHGWDVARSIGRPYDCEPEVLEAVEEFVAGFAGPGQEAARNGLFGPIVEVGKDAPVLDRVLGLTGRNPDWTA